VSNKKAARRRGKHVTYFASGVADAEGRIALYDWKPEGAQMGQPHRVSYKEWEEKYQDQLYLIEDTAWKPPPILRPTKKEMATAASLLKKRKEEQGEPAEVSEKREEALRGVVRRVAKWEGSQVPEDLAEAKQHAKFVVELWPSLSDKILKEFKRATEK